MENFQQLQLKLQRAMERNARGSRQPHFVIAMPSFSIGETTLSHYASRIPALEHRYLNAIFLLSTIPGCELLFLCSRAPAQEVLDYYFALFPASVRDNARSRFKVVTVPDERPRSLAEKLVDHPDVATALKRHTASRLGFIEPWNVTSHEVAVAELLQIPVNGTDPALWPIGFKSSGRKLFREAGVPVPYGVEDVRTPEDVVAAILDIRRNRPNCTGVVIKHDNSGAGDGNVVLRFDGLSDPYESVAARVGELPPWYLKDLQSGGIVEELVAGESFSSPSAQLDITPDGKVIVRATHEQVLGGPDKQVYMGCRFPADPAYAPKLAEYGLLAGRQLAARGVIGRFSVDFVAARNAEGAFEIYALEVNLRKGGTTHPYATLRHLVPGAYDSSKGEWRAVDGTSRAYCSTDNMVDERWTGLPPAVVIRQFRNAGLQFNPDTGKGVVLHMLSCLAVDGRFGLTAIAPTPQGASEIFDAAPSVVNGAEELAK
jgi:hypothetical protein